MRQSADIFEGLLDNIERSDNGQSSKKILSSSDRVDVQYLTSRNWYQDWINQGYRHLFLIEIPTYNNIDFIKEFRKLDYKVRTLFENLQNYIQMSELVAVSYCEHPVYHIRELYSELINSGELVVEKNIMPGVGIYSCVPQKYFYKFFAKSEDLQSVRSLLKLFATIGNICLETDRLKHYNITFKIVVFGSSIDTNIEYDNLRACGLFAIDVLRGERVRDEAIWNLASKFYYVFHLEDIYEKDPIAAVAGQIEDIYNAKRNLRKKIKTMNESVLDGLDVQETQKKNLLDGNTEMTYQEWYRKNIPHCTHLFVLYKYFTGDKRAEEIPMIKDMFQQIVERYYPDCSDVQVVNTQMTFYEEDLKYGIQYEPSYKRSGGVILDGITDSKNYMPSFKICVNMPAGRPDDLERFLNCISSLYSLTNYHDSGDYRGGKVEVYRKEFKAAKHFVHNYGKFSTDDIVGIDAFNYRYHKSSRYTDIDFEYTIKGYLNFKTFMDTGQEDLIKRLRNWYKNKK